jgi:hypothetical protein
MPSVVAPPPTTELPPAPAVVSVQIETTPAGAAVLDPSGAVLDHTPCTLSLPRGADALALRVTLEGYQDHEETITPDVNQRLRFTLTRAPRRPARESAGTSAHPPPPTTEARPDFFRFD